MVMRPELRELWSALRAHRTLLPRNATHIVLRVDRESGRHVFVRGNTAEVWIRAHELGDALIREGVPAVLWWEPAGGAPRAVFGSRQAYPAMVFEQVHPAMGDRVRAHAVAAMGAISGLHCWDLYAGIGETTRALAERGATVESVEVDRRAVAVAEERGPAASVTRLIARVEDAIGRLSRPDAVIVNPPRTGLEEAVTGHLTVQPPGRLVYVSCDPATLGRDLARLSPTLRVSDVRAFDLFPQTAHVETVVRLERR
jgi:tRNA/tmRNA/rRNA uracil-C5-methylase (TrmA/RlmC/RlmD family)